MNQGNPTHSLPNSFDEISPAAVQQHVVQLFRSAAEWQLLSLLFQCPDDAWRKDVKQLMATVEQTTLQQAAEAALGEATSGRYHFTFGPGGPAPPREISHRSSVVPGRLIAEICGFYDAFAYTPCLVEAPDHVAVETGFIAFLRLKEAYAHMQGTAEQAELAAQASHGFLDDHVSLLATRLLPLLQASGITYLELAGTALSILAPQQKAPPELTQLPDLPLFSQDESIWACGEMGYRT